MSPSFAGGITIAVPTRTNRRTPRSNKLVEHDRRNRTAHAERRCRHPATRTQACHRAEATVFFQKDWSFEVFGDPINASAVADKDRRLADVLLTASDVPGASRHVLLSPRSRCATRQQGARGLNSGLCGYRGRGAVQNRGREEAAQERVAGAGRVIRRERLDWKDIFAPALRKRDALATARLNEDLRSLFRARRTRALATNSASPRLNATRSARAAMAAARSAGTARASTLTAQTTLASGRAASRAAAGRPGGSDRQTDPVGGGDELALAAVSNSIGSASPGS